MPEVGLETKTLNTLASREGVTSLKEMASLQGQADTCVLYFYYIPGGLHSLMNTVLMPKANE